MTSHCRENNGPAKIGEDRNGTRNLNVIASEIGHVHVISDLRTVGFPSTIGLRY
jgi:hypothetical protein